MKYNYLDVAGQRRTELENLCGVNKYKVVKADKLPSGLIPQGLIDKSDSACIICSGSYDNHAYYGVNLNRVDQRDNAIDQQPFMIAFSGSTPICSGILIQHGDWDGRTTDLPSDYESFIIASGLHNYYPLSELPNDEEGSIEDLKIPSQNNAFQNLLKGVKIIKDS